MTTQSIVESGMTFGPYRKCECFHIERSECYAAIRKHVKMAEFLLLRGSREVPVMYVVEAKSSAPRPGSQDFDKFIGETREKLINAFALGWASCLKRHQSAEEELPERFRALCLSNLDVRFVLVINGHKDDWLPPLNDALKKALLSIVKCWALSPNSVKVLNDATAQEYGLIRPAPGSGN